MLKESKMESSPTRQGVFKSLIGDLRREMVALRTLITSQHPAHVDDWLRNNYLASVAQTNQLLLKSHYQQLQAEGRAMPSFADVEFRCFSQTGEDGIIHYVFAVLGTVPKRAVEVCAGNGIECNSANLIVNHGWDALLFDGDINNVAQGKEF